MTRWIGKRGLWGVVAGTAVAAGTVFAGPEVGDTVTFREGNKDRKVTITKVNKRADKSFEVTGKDAATGESMTWVEGGTGDAPPAPPAGVKVGPVGPATPVGSAKDAGLPKAKARADDPIGSAAAPMPETPSERERRLFNGKLFGRDTTPPAPAATASPAVPQIAEAGEPKQKSGLLNRLFGKKTPAPVPAAMPGPAVTTPTPAPVSAPATRTGPTAGAEPKVAPPVRPASPTPVRTTAPAAPPVSVIPVPAPLPATRPATPVTTPAIPTPLPAVPLPTIPSAPGGSQSLRPGQPVQVVLPVGYVPAEAAMTDDLRPLASALKDGGAATERLIAAKGLADGRHGSSDRVKAMLFAAAQSDQSSTVRAACIDHLVRLGYYDPGFLRHLQTVADGPAGEEHDAARAGLTRMTPRRW